VEEIPFNKFVASPVRPGDLRAEWGGGKIKVIQAFDGQLITGVREFLPGAEPGTLESDPMNDVIKLVVKDRYRDMPPSVAFISGFGLKRGAIASSVAHDSHNIIAAGVDDESMARAINRVITGTGGIALVDGEQELFLPLPFAGIMSGQNGYKTAEVYHNLDEHARGLGSPLRAPFMTLSFMALLVIPELKLSDQGLFDGQRFRFTSLIDF